jgi:hypothetical protein
VLLETVGAVGSGFTVTLVEAVIGQPFSVAVPVKVPEAEGVYVNGLVVPITEEPSDHENADGVAALFPVSVNIGRVVYAVLGVFAAPQIDVPVVDVLL